MNDTRANVGFMPDRQNFDLQYMELTQMNMSNIIINLYAQVVANPERFSRHPHIDLRNNGGVIPAGTYQYSASPTTPMEKLWAMAHRTTYPWTVAWTGSEDITDNTFIIVYEGDGTNTFDPTMETFNSDTVTWKVSDGDSDAAQGTKTTGAATSHAYPTGTPYIPSSGRHTMEINVATGITNVKSLNIDGDGIRYVTIQVLTACEQIYAYSNDIEEFDLKDLSRTASNMYINMYQQTKITGKLSNLPTGITALWISGCSLITGSTDDISTGLTIFDSRWSTITIGDLSRFTALINVTIDGMGLSQVQVDEIIDRIYQAVITNPDHFTNPTPLLYIGSNSEYDNAAPSGTYQYAANPSTGLEKVYYLEHLATHTWDITYHT
jgi:hypothetical protein